MVGGTGPLCKRPLAGMHRREKVDALLWRCPRGVGLADLRQLVMITTKVKVPGVPDVVAPASMMYVPAVITSNARRA